MPRFRTHLTLPAGITGIADLLNEVLRPCHFYQRPDLAMCIYRGRSETVSWEVYQGRLVDPALTRERRSFRAWGLAPEGASTADWPVVGLKWDEVRGEVHVVRALLTHVFETFEASGGVIETRPATRWLPELVGTLTLSEFADLNALHDELIGRLGQAVVGTSRLPLTSLEAPLPSFVLGQLSYVYRSQEAREAPRRTWQEIIRQAWSPELAWREQAKLLETVLRTIETNEVAEAAELLVQRWRELGQQPRELTQLLRTVFNDISLSPWTALAANVLAWMGALVAQGAWTPDDEADFLSWLLRQLGRHLTAYDLVVFHHQGANYPDALVLDAALRRLIEIAEVHPQLFEGDATPARLLRRGLRHGALLRRVYEGHAVPDAPTSPGENRRVLPSSFIPVPESQVSNPALRARRLFAESPLAGSWTPSGRRVFELSLADLADHQERLELGTATFIDRPLGFGKHPLEPDQTPLLAHEATSRRIALRRLQVLTEVVQEAGMSLPAAWPAWADAVARGDALPSGIPIACCTGLGRPVPSLADAQRVSDDFIVTRLLPSSVRLWQDVFDWCDLARQFVLDELWHGTRLLIRVPWGQGHSVMTLCALKDGSPVTRLVFESDPSRGYRCRGGVELPVAGLRIWRVVDERGVAHDLRQQTVHVASK